MTHLFEVLSRLLIGGCGAVNTEEERVHVWQGGSVQSSGIYVGIKDISAYSIRLQADIYSVILYVDGRGMRAL